MKLICVEEHVLDRSLGQASAARMGTDAPYAGDWGIRFADTGASTDTNRPRINAPKVATAKAFDMGQGRIDEMNAHGIDMQVLSYGGMHQWIEGEQAVALIAAANDRMAAAARQHPGRFAGFAALPWQDPPAAARELDRAVGELGLKGVLLSGRPGQHFIDAPPYAPVLARLNALRVPLFIHPGMPHPAVQQAYYGGFDRELTARLSLFAWGWHNEAGVHVVRMVLAGLFDRYPDLQVISGHWGELVPFFLQRLDDSLPREATGLSRSISDTYRQHVWVTLSGMCDGPQFEYIRQTIGIERLLYSVDYPYLSLNGARAWLEALPISAHDKALFAHGNAERLFRL
ncbi:MAG: amidohydrolase family protein [Pseudomonadota bacterium]|nr:amidohydrolase family protein [Pseudomonadota bacterium]